MKKLHLIYYIAASVAVLLTAASCKKDMTYAEMKEKERDAISRFISRDVTIRDHDGNELIHVGRINTISEEQFKAQGETTNVERNEYVMFGTVQSSNETLYYNTTPDIIDIANAYGTFTASFNTSNGGGAMYRRYGSTSVPAGWLIPFTYVRLGRQISDEQIAKVRIIVPHSQGQSDASSNVYPCFYQISFQETR